MEWRWYYVKDLYNYVAIISQYVIYPYIPIHHVQIVLINGVSLHEDSIGRCIYSKQRTGT